MAILAHICVGVFTFVCLLLFLQRRYDESLRLSSVHLIQPTKLNRNTLLIDNAEGNLRCWFQL